MGRKDKEPLFAEKEAPSLGARLRSARQQKGISLTQMATNIGYTKSHLSAVENGAGHPSLLLVEKYEKELGLPPGELVRIFEDLARTEPRRRPAEATERVAQVNAVRRPLPEKVGQLERPVPARQPRPPANQGQREDWRGAPSIRNFYGREAELNDLKQWILEDHAQLVVVLGIGGVGKTTLITRAMQEMREVGGSFKVILWRSLQDRPSIGEFLRDCIGHVSGHRHIDFPSEGEQLIDLFIEYLWREPCLVGIDNFESILQPGTSNGQYLEGYEAYGTLIERLAKRESQLLAKREFRSSFLLTSREQLKELASLDPLDPDVHALLLSGVGDKEGRSILEKDYKLTGTPDAFAKLMRLYSGNPLALRLAAAPIRTMFDSSIDNFLASFEVARVGGASTELVEVSNEAIITDTISDLLRQQFERISEPEREIMYWLAIEREATTLNDLQDDTMQRSSRGKLLQVLETLRGRSMIETEGGHFGLQPVIMEYVTHSFQTRIFEEIVAGQWDLLMSHLLLKAQAKDYVREVQRRFLLRPLANQLLAEFGKEGSEKRLIGLLSQLRETQRYTPGYAAGNILNLLIELKCDSHSYDFSDLVVKQAYLQGILLQGARFARAEFDSCTFTDPFERVLIAKLNADGTRLAAGTGNGDVWIWDVAGKSLTPLHICQGHTDWVRSIAFGDKGLLVSGSDDQTVRLWDIDTGTCRYIVPKFRSRVFAVAIRRDEKLIAIGDQEGFIHIWDVQSKQFLREFKEEEAGRIWALAFSPEGDMLASGGGSHSVIVWDVQTGERLHWHQQHKARVRSVSFSVDGQRLASGSRDGTVCIWNIGSNPVQAPSSFQGHKEGVRSVEFRPDGQQLASAGEDGAVRLWDSSTCALLRVIGDHTNEVRSVSFDHNGKFIVTASDDQTVCLWDVETRQCLNRLQGYSDWVYAVAFSPDGKKLASGGEKQAVYLWDVSEVSADRPAKLERILSGHTNMLRSIAFSHDGALLASAGEDHTIRLWKVSTGQCLFKLEGHKGWVYTVAFAPNGKILASGSEDHKICLWDIDTGQRLQMFGDHRDWIRSIAFSPDGRWLASGDEGRKIHLREIGGEGSPHILEGHTGRVYSVAFSPDGKTLISGSEDGEVRLWDRETQQCLRTFKGHTGRVWSTAFSPNGAMIASGGEDRTVRLWDVSGGYQMGPELEGFTNRIYSLAFSQKGLIAAGSHDGTVRLWDAQTTELLQIVKNPRPYEGMDITDVEGLTIAQKDMLKTLGALEK